MALLFTIDNIFNLDFLPILYCSYALRKIILLELRYLNDQDQ